MTKFEDRAQKNAAAMISSEWKCKQGWANIIRCAQDPKATPFTDLLWYAQCYGRSCKRLENSYHHAMMFNLAQVI